MSQEEGEQPLAPLTSTQEPSPTLATATRKLKRKFNKPVPTTNTNTNINTNTSPPSTLTTTPSIPTTPPFTSLDPPTPSNPTPSTPPATSTDESDELPSRPTTPINSAESETNGITPSVLTRKIKIVKSAKKAAIPKQQTTTSSTITTTTFETIVQAGTLRPDGTRRKEIKIRTKQLPKLLSSSPEKPAKKKLKVSDSGITTRIRPNTNFLTRLVKSADLHNTSLANMENSGSDFESGEGSSDENIEDEDEEEEEMDGENVDSEVKDNISTMLETAKHTAQKERRFIMHQIRRMRQLEGITIIKNLAKMYGLHVSIEEDENGGKKLTKANPKVRLVQSVGSIGYNSGI